MGRRLWSRPIVLQLEVMLRPNQEDRQSQVFRGDFWGNSAQPIYDHHQLCFAGYRISSRIWSRTLNCILVSHSPG